MVAPPSLPEVKLTVTCPSPLSMLDIDGAPGVVAEEPVHVEECEPIYVHVF